MGLVNRVFPHETFLEKTQETAQELASAVSPRSLRIIKRQVYEAMSQPLAEAFDISVREMIACFRTEDFKEGVAHFVQKRPAAFTGK
jgi:enoyl-CoA hydratase/carnithine racemase